MEIKKSRVTKLTKKDKDSYGKFSFIIEFENGDKGFYNTPNGDQTLFVAGNVSDYMIEAKTSKAGTTYHTITSPEEAATKPQGGFPQKPRQDPKVQFIGFAASYTKDFIVAGKIPLTDLEKEFNRIYNLMISKL